MSQASFASPIISLEKVCLRYGTRSIFKNLTWSCAAQQWTCLLGQSGIGKSSLLRLIAGLLPEDSKIEGTFHRHPKIAYLGQNDALLPWLNVLDNASLSARLGPYSRTEKKRILERSTYLLELVGLAGASRLYPRQLSGGMRQRVALVRALAEDKPIILMDEPFSRLDAITRHQLQNLAAELLKNKTVLLVTHDPTEALRLGDQIDLLSGQPATITTVATLTTPAPRELSRPDLLNLQKKLYQTLTDHYNGHLPFHLVA